MPWKPTRHTRLAAMVVPTVLLLACDNGQEAWSVAKAAGTGGAFEEFLEQYGSSPFADSARNAIEALDWGAAASQNDVPGYNGFLAQHPSGSLADSARALIERIDWRIAEVEDTPESYERFLAQYNDSQFAEDARQQLEDLVWRGTEAHNTIAAYEEYLTTFPNGRHAADAASIIERTRAVESYALQIVRAETFEAKQVIEERIVQDILDNGVSGRFVIPSIRPEGSGYSGSFAMDNTANENLVRWKTLYPRDELQFSFSLSGMQPRKPTGNLSVVRFMGRGLNAGDYTFDSQADEPLTFMLLEGFGFVYLHGRGVVSRHGQRVVVLP